MLANSYFEFWKHGDMQISKVQFKFRKRVSKANPTRRLVNVRLHMMFRPELIYIFDLNVNQMKR